MIKTLYIEGRPSAHPLHRKYGESINSDFIYVDFILRWHDKNSSAYRRYLSWIICAFLLPKRKYYDVIFSEGAHFIVGLQKWLHLINKKKKTIALLDNETLYFIDSDFYKPKTKKMFIALIKTYDGIICAGKMEADLARKYADPKTVVKQIFNGVNDRRILELLNINPDMKGTTLVFIGNIGAGWRSWYKGVDILLESFEIAWNENKQLKLKLIGEWDRYYLDNMLLKYAPESRHVVECVGYTNDLNFHLKDCSLYVHPARGEAWGISVTEAMAAGIIPLVSEFTGSREVVEKVDEKFVLPLNKEIISKKIIEYFKIDIEDKLKLSLKCKKIAAYYSETNAVNAFKKAFEELYDELSFKL